MPRGCNPKSQQNLPIKKGGRPKGSKNKAPLELRKFWQKLLDGNQAELEEDFKKLSGKDKLYIALRISELLLPKIQIPAEETDCVTFQLVDENGIMIEDANV